jgi:pyruvate formate lyase activating enzyme
VDLFLYDLKLMDDARHRAFTGVSNAVILYHLEELARRGHAIVPRVPVIPGVNDDVQNIRRAGAFLAGLPGILQVHLLPYHPSATGKYRRLGLAYGLRDTRRPSEAEMAEVAQTLRSFGLQVRVGG